MTNKQKNNELRKKQNQKTKRNRNNKVLAKMIVIERMNQSIN